MMYRATVFTSGDAAGLKAGTTINTSRQTPEGRMTAITAIRLMQGRTGPFIGFV
jgi:hypothetical protein